MQMPMASLVQSNAQKWHFGVVVCSLPRCGKLVWILGEELRAKTALGELVTIGSGKIVSGGSAFFTSPLPVDDSIQPVYRP